MQDVSAEFIDLLVGRERMSVGVTALAACVLQAHVQ